MGFKRVEYLGFAFGPRPLVLKVFNTLDSIPVFDWQPKNGHGGLCGMKQQMPPVYDGRGFTTIFTVIFPTDSVPEPLKR